MRTYFPGLKVAKKRAHQDYEDMWLAFLDPDQIPDQKALNSVDRLQELPIVALIESPPEWSYPIDPWRDRPVANHYLNPTIPSLGVARSKVRANIH